MNCSTPGLPVHHQLPEFTQTHIHRVSDAIQPSHPLSSPSPPAPNPSHIHQHKSATGIHVSPPFWNFLPSPTPSHPSRLSQSTGLSALCHTANFHWLSILHMVMYMCWTEYASKFGKHSSGHRTGKGQFSFQSQRKTMPKMFKLLHNYTHLTR